MKKNFGTLEIDKKKNITKSVKEAENSLMKARIEHCLTFVPKLLRNEKYLTVETANLDYSIDKMVLFIEEVNSSSSSSYFEDLPRESSKGRCPICGEMQENLEYSCSCKK